MLTTLTLLAIAAAPPASPIDFARDVRPLLQARCVACHGPAKQKGNLRLDEPTSGVRTGNVLPGKGDASPLVHRITGQGDEPRMPPGKPLTPQQIATLRAWIDQGAKWPVVAGEASGHWAYRPLRRPPLPAVKERSRIRNVVDIFVQARLDAAGLKPAPVADRRTLLRRLSFDLLGLPPSPDDVAAFEADTRPDAYERLVDRLLASPAYGERYARHWLDVIHFAETHGHDQDVPRENAWPYRDYLIRAFNADRGWNRMVEEQVAGDILYPETPEGVVALGLLSAGPWDESSQQSIRDDTVDKKQAQNIDRDDMVTTVMSAFVSATVHCARCHDHKFDPISQAEHYALQAVFAGVDRANRVYDRDPSVHRQRRELVARQKEIQTSAALLTAETDRRVERWLAARGKDAWHALHPDRVVTQHGSEPTVLADDSVRFGGPRPDRDTYTVTATTAALRQAVTAIRLDVLADDALPQRGPGRQDNGNLHLNEFRVEVADADRPKERRPVAIRSATADFDQADWDVGKAIDGKPATAWGIHPAVGKSHHAVFVFDRPVSTRGKATFTVTLEQTHGRGHLIGRLRLSVTSATAPATLAPLPSKIANILDTPSGKRSPNDRLTLARHVLLEDVQAQLDALPKPAMVYAGASDFVPESSFKPAKGCRPIFLLRRGEVTKPTTPVGPGALACVPDLPATFAFSDDEGARRAALARWLSDSRNVLTWRSIANRVWHYHFGRGLVATPGDLGKMGAPPTHPELLDWLAVEVRESGGSLKHLHRLIVRSDAYRRSVQHDPAAAKVDADNQLLWRMNRTRLDAESVRDAMLAVTGLLDRRMGGPSVKHFRQSKGIHVTPVVDYAAFDVDAPGSYRRSVYRFIFRTLPDPFLETLDCPDASQFTPARSSSVTPLQALALLNDRFMVRQADHFAARVKRDAGDDPTTQLRRAYALAYGRAPGDEELTLLRAYLARHGLANACRLLVNANEFLFID